MNTESSEKKLIILHTITAVVISIDVFPDLYTYVILGATIVVLMDVLSFSNIKSNFQNTERKQKEKRFIRRESGTESSLVWCQSV